LIIFIMLLLLTYVCSIPATLFVGEFNTAICLYLGGAVMLFIVAQAIARPHSCTGIKWFILSVFVLALWPLVALRLVYICYLDKIMGRKPDEQQ